MNYQCPFLYQDKSRSKLEKLCRSTVGTYLIVPFSTKGHRRWVPDILKSVKNIKKNVQPTFVSEKICAAKFIALLQIEYVSLLLILVSL